MTMFSYSVLDASSSSGSIPASTDPARIVVIGMLGTCDRI